MNVDDLARSLCDGFFVSDSDSAVYDPCRPHPRFSDYKSNNFVKRNQEKRRRELLERQKEKRFDSFLAARNLDLFDNDDDEASESPMDVGKVGKKSRKPPPYHKRFKDQLMLSEWLVDVPENFSTNWFMIPCPEGKRCLVVAERGETRSYSKSGHERNSFPSFLPGGNRNSFNHVTWLDCVFSDDKIFYVLDVIQWQDVSIYDGDREFRYFWVQQKFAELDGIGVKSQKNRYPFVLPPQCLCTKENLASAMREDFPFKVDGLLFYCNEAHYVAGLTPLVGWLKPFMVKEVLNVDVPEKYSKDGFGTTTAKFIDDFNTKNQKNHNSKLNGQTSMEIETAANENSD